MQCNKKKRKDKYLLIICITYSNFLYKVNSLYCKLVVKVSYHKAQDAQSMYSILYNYVGREFWITAVVNIIRRYYVISWYPSSWCQFLPGPIDTLTWRPLVHCRLHSHFTLLLAGYTLALIGTNFRCDLHWCTWGKKECSY